jgi:hypothetical protein
MRLESSILMGLVSCFFTGVFLMKGQALWDWSLRRRAYLRYGTAFCIAKYRGFDKLTGYFKRNNPFEIVIQFLKNYRKQKMDKEIFESITFLRNLASIEKGKTTSSDYIIEKLAEHNGLLQPVFLKMLNLLRINQTKEAAAFFTQRVGTTSARDFAGLLIRWDSLAPADLMETLFSYEKSMKAVRLTEQKKKDEIISDMVYFPVVVNILVIFVNFIYVAYFLDQKEMLQMFM